MLEYEFSHMFTCIFRGAYVYFLVLIDPIGTIIRNQNSVMPESSSLLFQPFTIEQYHPCMVYFHIFTY